MRTRFAPSPTGYLHVGGARTALFNWLLARRHGGQFVLRIEDTDEARNTEPARAAIFEGLRWLGLDWDEGPDPARPDDLDASVGPHGPHFQSRRRTLYDEAFARLQAAGRVYEDQGAWRFRFERRPVTVQDLICGPVTIDFANEAITPDMTIRRPDGSYIFHFVNVVDDIDMRISHVVRGEDHLSNTHKHLQLFEALGAAAPQYAHIPLILNDDGSKMSKRDQGASLAFYREQGFVPEGVVNYLAQLGWTPGAAGPEPEREIFSLAELVERFDLAAVHHKNAAFDLGKCRWMSAQHLRALPLAELAERAGPALAEARLLPAEPATTEALLTLAQPRVETLAELPAFFAQYADDQPDPGPEATAKAFADATLRAALASLADTVSASAAERWTQAEIQQLLAEAAAAHGLKAGKLMFPLRVATTGATGGPDLLPLLELVGPQRTAARLRHTLASAAA